VVWVIFFIRFHAVAFVKVEEEISEGIPQDGLFKCLGANNILKKSTLK